MRRPPGARSSTSSVGAILRGPRRSSSPSRSSSARQPLGRSAALDARERPQVVDVRGAGRHEPHGANHSVPVPPSLRKPRVLAPVHDHHELVGLPRAQAARLDGEGRVGIDVAADPAAVQKHARVAAHALELDQPAEAGRGLGAGEGLAIATHLAWIESGDRPRVEDARDPRGPPLSRRLGRAAGRRARRAQRRILLRRLFGRRGLGQPRRGRFHPDLPVAREWELARGRLRDRGGCGCEQKQAG